MSTETLMRAATEIRRDQRVEESLGHIGVFHYDAWLAVADWLEYVGDVKADSLMPSDQAVILHALAIAHAYLGEAS